MKKSKYETGLIEVDITAIQPYGRNVRDNNDTAVKAVADSITKYGYQNPIIVDQELVVIAGHTRLKALQQLGYEAVPVLVVDMPEAKAKEFRVVDNRTNEYSQWDNQALSFELREFVDQQYAQLLFPEIRDNVKMQEATDYGYSEAEVSKTGEKLEGAFQEKSEQRNDAAGFVHIPCPHCDKSFAMARNDLISRFHYSKAEREGRVI